MLSEAVAEVVVVVTVSKLWGNTNELQGVSVAGLDNKGLTTENKLGSYFTYIDVSSIYIYIEYI